MTTVYYDGMCGLCAREIAYYRRIAPEGAIEWRDIARDPTPLGAIGVDQADALKLLHAVDDDGRVRIGVDAFVTMWRKLPWWRRLAPIVAAPIVRPVIGWIYRRFAAWRFARLDHCQIAARDAEGAR